MPTYQLSIGFTDAGLDTLQAAKQQVTMVKSVNSSAGSSGSNPVIWVSFKPMNANTVTWDEEYSVYASTTNIVNGAQIITNSSIAASSGNAYTFLPAGHFGASNSNLSDTEYGVINNSSFAVNGIPMITSGLYQTAVVNGTPKSSPLNATPVPFGDTATFTPIEKVQVFVSSYQNNGLVIAEVTSQALTVDFTTQPTQSIIYDAATNQFVLGSGSGG
jgi:hypothetical protein